MKNTIKVERARRDMTQQALADLVGVSRQTINYIETQRYMPSAALVLKLAQVFGMSVEELFALEEEDW
jgi:putative transcriptional regulator